MSRGFGRVQREVLRIVARDSVALEDGTGFSGVEYRDLAAEIYGVVTPSWSDYPPVERWQTNNIGRAARALASVGLLEVRVRAMTRRDAERYYTYGGELAVVARPPTPAMLKARRRRD